MSTLISTAVWPLADPLPITVIGVTVTGGTVPTDPPRPDPPRRRPQLSEEEAKDIVEAKAALAEARREGMVPWERIKTELGL